MIKQRLQKKQDIMELSAQKMAIETRINIIIGLIQQGTPFIALFFLISNVNFVRRINSRKIRRNDTNENS